MQPPTTIDSRRKLVRWYLTQMWRDLLSVYYANSLIWRWMKSGGLVFLGLCSWAGASVLLSVRPAWTFLYLVMAYGFVLVLWGPLTHFVFVPAILRWRRTAQHPVTRFLSRHGGKLNLTIFFTIVVLLAISPPSVMILEFAPLADGDRELQSGDLVCENNSGDVITCEVYEPKQLDHVVILVNDEVIDRADDPPYRVEISRDQLGSDDRFVVEYRNANGATLRRFQRSAF